MEQKVPSSIPWEVVVVDNASDDDTAEVARRAWSCNPPAPLVVVHEPNPGLSHARYRGFSAAKLGVVSFIDDDNWVCRDWVSIVDCIMSEHPEIGACGGLNDPVCERPPPEWFHQYQYAYACGPQGTRSGYVADDRGFLWGAGLSIRRIALEDLYKAGFQSLLSDRTGKSLAAGGDLEICAALRLMKWQLWYEPELRLNHFLPAKRLTWSYLRRLVFGFGVSEVGLTPYLRLLGNGDSMLTDSWRSSSLRVLWSLLRFRLNLVRSVFGQNDGAGYVLAVDKLLGRLKELCEKRSSYDVSFSSVNGFFSNYRIANGQCA